MYGAAWATVLGFLCNVAWVVVRGRSLVDMQLDWMVVVQLLAVAAALYVSSLFVVGGAALQFGVKVGLVLIFAAIFFFRLTVFQRRLIAAFFTR
jgi:hypothetical protein